MRQYGWRRFRELLPWLLLFAAVMFALSFPLGRWLQTLSGGRRYDTGLLIGMVIVSIYVGYFGAGGGFLVMALFASIGGYLGAHYSRKVNQRAMRWAVVVIGFVTAGYFFLENYLHHV